MLDKATFCAMDHQTLYGIYVDLYKDNVYLKTLLLESMKKIGNSPASPTVTYTYPPLPPPPPGSPRKIQTAPTPVQSSPSSSRREQSSSRQSSSSGDSCEPLSKPQLPPQSCSGVVGGVQKQARDMSPGVTRSADRVSLEMAVLRYRAVVGTASMNQSALCSGVTKALLSTLEDNRERLEKIHISPDKSTPVMFQGNNHYICGWPMLTFDIKLIRKKLLINDVIIIRIYVAADMLRNAQIKADTIKYCTDHNIIVVDNLFTFCQPAPTEGESAEAGAEALIMQHARNFLGRGTTNGNTTSSNSSHSSHNGGEAAAASKPYR